MAKIPRLPEPDEKHCYMCDFFGFERQYPTGTWAYCFFKGRHFPEGVLPGGFVCFEMSFGSRPVFEKEKARH